MSALQQLEQQVERLIDEIVKDRKGYATTLRRVQDNQRLTGYDYARIDQALAYGLLCACKKLEELEQL